MKLLKRLKRLLAISVSLLMIAACMLNSTNSTITPKAFEVSSIPTATPSHTPSLTSTTITVESQIKDVIESYFDIRYRMFSTLQLESFGGLISNSPEADSFLTAEMRKLEVEIKHVELEHLRYIQYEIILDYEDISIDYSSQSANVTVIEGYNVIRELSLTLRPENPVVSKMRSLEHTITLHIEEGQWKIVSDYYNDYLWRMLRQPGISSDELLNSIEERINSTATAIAFTSSATPMP